MRYSGQAFDSPEEALAHYGVLGMKWGVRKDNKPQGFGNPNYRGPLKKLRAKRAETRSRPTSARTQAKREAARKELRRDLTKIAVGTAVAAGVTMYLAGAYVSGDFPTLGDLKKKAGVAGKVEASMLKKTVDSKLKDLKVAAKVEADILKAAMNSAGSAKSSMASSMKTPASSIPKTPPPTVKKAAEKAMKQPVDPFKKMVADFEKSISEAHSEQTAWMKKQTPGVYNPANNPFSPEGRRKQLGR